MIRRLDLGASDAQEEEEDTCCRARWERKGGAELPRHRCKRVVEVEVLGGEVGAVGDDGDGDGAAALPTTGTATSLATNPSDVMLFLLSLRRGWAASPTSSPSQWGSPSWPLTPTPLPSPSHNTHR